MTARPIAAAFGDLTSSKWHHVAERVRRGDLNVWVWRLSDADRDALIHARDVLGTARTMQERVGTDGMRLVARMVRVRGATGRGVGRARIAHEAVGCVGMLTRAAEVQKPLAAPLRPVLARVPRSPKAWHPDDDLARVKARLAASGGSLGADGLASGEAVAGASEADDGEAA